METREQKLERRIKVRKERLKLMNRESFLSDSYCSICPMNTSTTGESHVARCSGCPVYSELNGIGTALLKLSRDSYQIPEELTWKAYLELSEKMEWSKKEIAKYYGVGLAAFTEFTRRYEKLIPDTYEEETEMTEEKKEGLLTLAVYNYMQAEGKSDQAIIRELGITQHIMNKFKRANNLVGNNSGKRKGPKKPVEKTPVAPMPKEEPIEVDTESSYEELERKHLGDFDKGTGIYANAPGAIDSNDSDSKAEPKLQKIYIVMDTTDEAGSRSIKAIRSTKELAYLFIAEYVLAEDVNTAYLELVEKIVDAEEVY